MYCYVLFVISLWGSMKTVSLQVPPTCGQVCDFDRNYRHAQCDGIELREVPTSDGCQLARLLDLSGNEITSMHENVMLGYRDVEHLDLSNNVISSLEPHSFAGCNSAIYIYLSSNRIVTLEDEVFVDCQGTLKQLQLDRNDLEVIENGALKNLTKLTHLFLSHNRLENLPYQIFQDLHSLESLYLNSNRLTSLPAHLFANLDRLQNLDLSNNNLLVLGDELFSPRCQLVTFVLASNRLRNVPNPSSNCCLNGLQTLDIRSNNITDASNITRYILTTQKLFINDNPFHCDCSLEDVRIWIQEEVTSKTSSELSCIDPSSGERTLIRSLPDLCPATTTHPVTSTVSQSTARDENNQKTASMIVKTVSKKAMKGNEKEDAAENEEQRTVSAERLVFEDDPLSYYGLVAAIMVVAILVLVILVSIIILLAICLCQTNKNVEKMTKAILESKRTPGSLKRVVRRAKNLTSPKVPTNNREEQMCKSDKADTPRKARNIPQESTPKETRIDMTGLRKRSPQESDKMLEESSPRKTQNDQKRGDIDGGCERSSGENDKEKKPCKRKLDNQFREIMSSPKVSQQERVEEVVLSNHDGNDTASVNSGKYDYDKENSLNESFRSKDLEQKPQKGERKGKVLQVSDRDNLNVSSSNC